MSAVAIPASPFRGLSAFGDSELDALLFFGRARETEVIAANLQASRLTVLYGPTGVGKSSVLRAGVAQRLRREHDVAVAVVDAWAGSPVAAVEEALASAPPDGDLYMILDQFEEYFVYHADEDALPRLLGEIVRDRGARVNVLIGIRDDAVARLDEFRAQIPNLLGNRLALDRLDREAARRAIHGPVERYNELTGERVAFEPALVGAVLNEVTAGRVELGRPGRGTVEGPVVDLIEAPYLQLVLERLWDAERAAGSSVLRLETLRRLGGSAQIVGDHLQHAMNELSSSEKETAAEMYDHLVTPSGTKIAHRVGDLARYASVPEDEAARVLQKLARERILRSTSENGMASARYEIYHDVLADAVLEWRQRHDEQRVLHHANAARRRARIVAAAALGALLIVAAIAVFALLERSHARADAKRARARALVAEARTDLDVDPRQSIALALDATRSEHSKDVEDILRDSLIASHVRAVIAAPKPVIARSLDFVLTGDASGTTRRLANDGSVLGSGSASAPVTSVGTAGKVSAVGLQNGSIFGPGGARRIDRAVTALAVGTHVLAAGSSTGRVRLWRGPRTSTLHVRGRVNSLAFSPDKRLLLVTSRDRRARLVEVRTGRIVHTLEQRGFINAAAFSPDGRLVVTGSQDRTARFWSTRTGRALHTTEPATGGLTAVAFSPDGALVAIASADAVARVYDVATGAIRFYLSSDVNAITDIGFSPSGKALVTASSDRTTRIWTADVGRLLFVLRGHTDAVRRAFFTSDGERVVTASDDGTVRVWDPGTEPDLQVVVRQRAEFARATRGPDGTIAVTDASGRVVVLDPTARRVMRRSRTAPPRRTPVRAVQGNLTARALPDGSVDVMRGGHTIHHFAAEANSLAFSPDGRLLASGGHDGYLRVWDVDSGRVVHAVVAHQGPVADATFSPDGRWIVTAGPISAGVWSVATRRQLLLLHGPSEPLQAALFTRDGRTIVTAGKDGTIRTYDCVVCGTLPQLVRVAQSQLAQTRPR